MSSDEIFCIGEVLWDSFPQGLLLGGAVMNAACHLKKLGQEVSLASRIGDDELGREVVKKFEQLKMSAELLQRDTELPTGMVIVTFDRSNSPCYEIVAPAAWDNIGSSEQLRKKARNGRVVVVGTLAQRNERSRKTIRELLELGKLCAVDINLRPPYDDRGIVEETLTLSHIVKLNDTEAKKLSEWFGYPSDLKGFSMALMKEFDLQTICVTKGPEGAALLHEGQFHEHPGYSVDVVDTVGSGDAFMAGLISCLLSGKGPTMTLAFANALGALVASKEGAIPDYKIQEIDNIIASATDIGRSL